MMAIRNIQIRNFFKKLLKGVYSNRIHTNHNSCLISCLQQNYIPEFHPIFPLETDQSLRYSCKKNIVLHLHQRVNMLNTIVFLSSSSKFMLFYSTAVVLFIMTATDNSCLVLSFTVKRYINSMAQILKENLIRLHLLKD